MTDFQGSRPLTHAERQDREGGPYCTHLNVVVSTRTVPTVGHCRSCGLVFRA